MKNFSAKLTECPLIAILRGVQPDEVIAVGDALYSAGFRMLEIPLNSPDALTSIARAAAHFHTDGRVLVGAGTVLSPDDVRAVAKAGGRYIISPNTDAEVIRETVAQNLISIPGFLTPSEAFTALRAGAHYLKLFPATAFPIAYIKDLQAVVKAPIMAVGGVGAGNLREYLALCCGAGIGSSLYKPGKALDAIAHDARALIAALK